MSEINPEAGQAATVQSFAFSDRNPVVTHWGGTDAEGAQVPAPAASEIRMTPPGVGPSADAGMVNDDAGISD
jgi:hypothetical protein